jgi:hypothetical protein
MLVVEEGGSTFFHNMTMVLDGATGIEHNLPVAPLYKRRGAAVASTDVRNTPTLVVSYGGLSGEYWWYARDNVWEDRKLNRYFPRETLDARASAAKPHRTGTTTTSRWPRPRRRCAMPACASRSAATASCRAWPPTGRPGC